MHHYIIHIFVFLFGATVGSFLNVCIYRIPAGLSIVFPSSNCPKCHAKIKPYDNIPILSYIILRGKCRSCKAPFSARYALVELVTGLFALATYLRFGLTPSLLFYFMFIATLIVITFIDIDHYIIPDVISIPMLAIGLVASIFSKKLGLAVPLKSALIGSASGAAVILLIAGLYYVIKKKEGMGMGDTKLLAMLGAFLGVKSIFFIIFVGSLLGAVYAIPYMLISKKGRDQMIPFGPFLCSSAVIYLFYGEQIIMAYLRLATY